MHQHDTAQSANLLSAKRLWKRATAPGLPRAALLTGITLALLVLGGAGYVSATEPTTIMRGVRVAHVELGGLTPDAARERLREATERLTLTYTGRGTTLEMVPTASDASSDGPVAIIDINAAIANAVRIGTGENPFLALFERVHAGTLSVNIPLAFTLDEAALIGAVEARFGTSANPARDARFDITVSANGTPTVEIVPETEGTSLDHGHVVKTAVLALRTLTPTETEVAVVRDLPMLRAGHLEPLVERVPDVLSRLPIRVRAGREMWTIDARTAAQWLTATPGADGEAMLALDGAAIAVYLQPRADLIATKPKDAVFVEEDGHVTAFAPHQDGTMLDMDAAAHIITNALLSTDEGDSETAGATTAPLELPIITDPAKVSLNDANPYGIRELIGSGATNFRGSPNNRRHNINVGRAALDGLLLHPGDTFSVLAALGPINAASGYLEELVIKETRTIPEYGGGLCQVSSTLFRAVLDTGLPIVERRNHSYRVSYYENDGDGNYIGPGKDATIYGPAPDLKFTNDMESSILVRAYLETADKIVFEMWGASDGRIAEQTDAVILSTTPAPRAKLIKTTSVPVGVRRCTESARAGATTKFTYTVTSADGESKVEDFMSYYRPWGEVCLLGVSQETLDAEKEAGTVDASGLVL